MKKSKNATSIVEAMIVTLIIVMWLTWIYKIFSVSIKLTNSIENKIQAIQIAREWIEAMTNIRDTNSILFSADIDNCWKTFNYDANCIWGWGNIIEEKSYKIYKNNSRWVLGEPLVPLVDFSDPIYRVFYRVGLDWNWLYTQTWTTNNLNPIFTREIKIDYVEAKIWSLNLDNWIKIKSIVSWKDSSSDNIHKIELETVLTNHK